MKTYFCALLTTLFLGTNAKASYSNFNSVLIGDRAAGMGGAATALYEDSAATPFYNPGALARVTKSNFSTSASVYHKYDTNYNDQSALVDATRRINQGTFRAIPAISSNTKAFGLFGLSFSILFPDYEYFVGPVKSINGNVSHLSFQDESLWVGGGMGMNIHPQIGIGLSMYYTARDFYRSVFDQKVVSSTDITTVNEEKSFTHNALVYIFGVYYQHSDELSFGISYRFPSLDISGRGSYLKTTIKTNPIGNKEEILRTDLRSFTQIPPRLALGTAYRLAEKFIYSFDVTFYSPTSYEDLEATNLADVWIHKPIFNYSAGMEYAYRPYLKLRLGVYTNNSSHPEPTLGEPRRQGDHIDMWGLSGNIAFYTSPQTSFTFGGYYTGGRGKSTQLIGNQIQITPKSEQIFSMLIASSYFF